MYPLDRSYQLLNMQQQQQHITHLAPWSNYDVTELKLENGHLAMCGLGGFSSTSPAKPTWSNRACDTLESIVHQATCHKVPETNLSSMVSSSGGTWTDDSSQPPLAPGWIKKRTRSDSDYDGKNISSITSTTSNVLHKKQAEYQRDNDTTLNTWASLESPKNKSNDDDSTCHEGLENQDEGRETTKGDESSRSRPRRVAAIHNQSERKRRDRINQKMKALQRLVPNASKTDKASMLDEVIKYLEQLQAQVLMMSSMRNNLHPRMNLMMPLGMQQQQHHQEQQHLHQMSVLARMRMTPVVPAGALGMGMLDISNMARMTHPQQPLIHPTPASFLPPFMVPQLMQPKPDHPAAVATNANSDPLADPYCALLAQQQSMNMDLFNRMAALYHQQVDHQTTASSPSQSNH